MAALELIKSMVSPIERSSSNDGVSCGGAGGAYGGVGGGGAGGGGGSARVGVY